MPTVPPARREEPTRPEFVFVATVQVVIEARDADWAADILAETLGEDLVNDKILDWCYLKVQGQYLYPTKRYLGRPYQEGDAFAPSSDTDQGS